MLHDDHCIQFSELKRSTAASISTIYRCDVCRSGIAVAVGFRSPQAEIRPVSRSQACQSSGCSCAGVRISEAACAAIHFNSHKLPLKRWYLLLPAALTWTLIFVFALAAVDWSFPSPTGPAVVVSHAATQACRRPAPPVDKVVAPRSARIQQVHIGPRHRSRRLRGQSRLNCAAKIEPSVRCLMLRVNAIRTRS